MNQIEMHKHLQKHKLDLHNLKKKLKHPKYHKAIHKIRKYGYSKKILLYIKEYGPHTNVPKTIIKESLNILILASLLSSFGGFALENIKELFVTLTPLVILLPVLNGIAGNYGTIISSRFTTLLHEGKINGNPWHRNRELREIFAKIVVISIIIAILSASVALVISLIEGTQLDLVIIYKIAFIAVIDILILVFLSFAIAISAGLYFFKKGEDPDNFLIPITTSLADLGNMVLLTILVILLF